MLSRKTSLRFLTIVAVVCSVSSVKAMPIHASDAYYTFGPNVSANSGIRLLADKAADIGFPDFQSISFLKFDHSDLPSSTLEDNNLQAFLTLEQDFSLAPTLISASIDRPLSLSIYSLTGAFDPVNGNHTEINYGVDGANAIATTQIGNDGFYSWDITSLVDDWITSPSSNNGFALSGLFGNADIDGRNSYGIFHTVGSTSGLAPNINVVPEPLIFGLFGMGLVIIYISGQRRRKQVHRVLTK